MTKVQVFFQSFRPLRRIFDKFVISYVIKSKEQGIKTLKHPSIHPATYLCPGGSTLSTDPQTSLSTTASPNQPRHVISPACPGSAPGGLQVGHAHLRGALKHLNSPFNMKEQQQLHTELLAKVAAVPSKNTKSDRDQGFPHYTTGDAVI